MKTEYKINEYITAYVDDNKKISAFVYYSSDFFFNYDFGKLDRYIQKQIIDYFTKNNIDYKL